MTRSLFYARPKLSICLFSLALAACAASPYKAPEMSLPAQFKEAPAGWKNAQPADAAPREGIWLPFADKQLDALMAELLAANQSLQVAQARWRQATATSEQAQAALFPSLSANASDTRSRSTSSISNSAQIGLSTSWEIDLWGRVRDQVSAQNATAAASFADLANTRLSLEASLASNYFALRVADAQGVLLRASEQAYKDALDIAQNRFAVGVIAQSDVTLAKSQWLSARSQTEDNAITRAQLEHAIAILVGKAPSEFSIAAMQAASPVNALSMLPMQLPSIPASVPSSLLERRPDIATAERQVAAANASVGVARAALFPTLSLSGTAGLRDSSIAGLFGLGMRYWSVGPALALTLFDNGARQANIRQAEANYDATVANYRQSVLTALQGVEDQLVALNVLSREIDLQHQASQAAAQTVESTLNQYKAGTVPYLNVLTALTTYQSAQRSELNTIGRQLTASVQLIKALGGGWQKP